MVTLIAFIIALGILIFIHEFGHFIVAKWSGVRVEKFSLGFGPKIFGFQRGETEYLISALPLGGYVKMTGEDPGEDAQDDPRSFSAKSAVSRGAIIFAGPLMNFLLPFFFMPAVFMLGITIPAYLEQPPVIGWVMPDSSGAEAGFVAGDRIVRIDEEEVETWEEAYTLFHANPGRQLEVLVAKETGMETLSIEPRPSSYMGSGEVGIIHPMDAIIESVVPGSAADSASLARGDRIEEVDGTKIVHFRQLAEIISAHPEETLTFVIRRGGETMRFEIAPEREEETGEGVLGIIGREETVSRRYGLGQAIAQGSREVTETVRMIMAILGKLVTLDLSIKALGGPIMVAHAAGEAARSGIAPYLHLIAFLSLSLAVLNLLPIPILDGGHLLFILIEMLLRRPVSLRVREVTQQVGLVFLILLMLVVSYHDILRVLPGKIENLIGR